MSLFKCLSISATLSALALAALGAGGCSKTTNAASPDAKPSYPSTLSGGAPCGSCIAPANLSWKTVVTSPGEPGEPLRISGTISQPDGKPAEGIVLFIYHTDATGYYNEKDDASHPRLKGWMKTGPDGRYEFRTIKPARPTLIGQLQPTFMRTFMGRNTPRVRLMTTGSKAIPSSPPKSLHG